MDATAIHCLAIQTRSTFYRYCSDLYVSTFQALDWMFKHNLARTSTIIDYVDWCLTHLVSTGESRAHNKISLKYKVKFRCILGGCTDEIMKHGKKSNYYRMVSSKILKPIFVVEPIGFHVQSGMDGCTPPKM